ncbi:MAG TPA: DUF4062 domain-containing protein [Mycobacteriales bacterium]
MRGVSGTQIQTPDRRVRVFVSSTLQELAEERRAAKAAVAELRLTAVMFELGARPHPPRELYRAYLAQSDVFVGIYWQRYGWVAPGETVSGLEDEYLLSGDRPKLIYVKDAGQREPRLEELLTRIRADDRAAYKPFRDAAELGELLADDLAVLLTERFTAPAAEAPAAAPGLRRARLPLPPTRLVGREAEVAAVRSVLTDDGERLVTLVGPGGIGKTRLALEVAYGLESSFEGAWFVDLSPLSEAAQVPGAVAAALGIRAEGSRPVLEVIVDRLRDRRVLLVLDNFEQVLAAAPAVATVLTACPRVTVLVTSRTVLRLRGEREIPLAPLATAAAVDLFVARARDVRPGFTPGPANAAAVDELCRRLDGIPLAVELAAAQLRLLTPAALLGRLGDRLDSLDLPAAGPVDLPRRQRTLRATVEWSHSLLAPDERALLARLSVFAGSFTLDAAEAVGSFPAEHPAGLDVLSVLSSLVAQSLVSPDDQDADEPRFRMLDSVRAFARERLDERGERDATTRLLVGWLREFVHEAGAELEGPDNRGWGQRVDRELPDLRAAIRASIAADDAESAIRLTAPLFSYWWSRGQLAALRSVAEEVAALPSAATLPADAAALLLWARGMFRISAGEIADAEPYLRRLDAAAGDLGDGRLRAHALTGLGLVTAATDPAAAGTLADEAVGVFRRIGDVWGSAFALSTRGQLALQAGDPAGAVAAHTEALAAAEKIDNDHLRAQVLDLLGLDALATGDVAGARGRFAAAAQVHGRLLDQEGAAYTLDGFAGIALAQGRAPVAARLLGASSHAREVVGVAVWPGMRPLAEAMTAAVAAAVGEPDYAAARAEGARMRTPDALAYALSATDPGGTAGPAGPGGAGGPAGGADSAGGRPGQASADDPSARRLEAR